MCSKYDAQKQTLTHPEDCLCDDCQREACPKLVIDRERGASRSDAASGQAPKFLSGLPVATPENTGAESSNTAPSNLQSHLLSFPDTSLSTGGFDYLSLTCYGKYDPAQWEHLTTILSKAQESALLHKLHGLSIEIVPGIEFLVMPSGRGKGYSYAKWAFKYRSIEFRIIDHQDSQGGLNQKERYNLSIDVPSMPLMTFGEMQVYDEIRNVFRALNYLPYKIVPSRVDFCVDLVDVSVLEFNKAIQQDRMVSRTDSDTIRRKKGRAQTLYIGTEGSPIFLRIYDKYAECKSNEVKYDLLVGTRWGKDPDPDIGATRVEFQIRRDHLRDQHDVMNFTDLIEKRSSICHWLTHDWFRLTEEEPDGNHTERFGPSKLWQSVIDAFNDWTGKEIKARAKREVIGANPEQLILQSTGCLVSCLALLGIIPDTKEELEEELATLLRNEYSSMLDSIPFRRKQFEAERPYLIVKKADKAAS